MKKTYLVSTGNRAISRNDFTFFSSRYVPGVEGAWSEELGRLPETKNRRIKLRYSPDMQTKLEQHNGHVMSFAEMWRLKMFIQMAVGGFIRMARAV